ncbi:MAG: hypothetical protein QOE64_2219, partial [Frankiales bacterium]|nr:hypothetical protein [Frankiales bacterium]
LAPAVFAYGIVLGAMALLATGVHRLSGIGAAIFLTSDTVIIVNTFVLPGRIPLSGIVIMATYLTGQLLIILGVLRASQLSSTLSAETTGRPAQR